MVAVHDWHIKYVEWSKLERTLREDEEGGWDVFSLTPTEVQTTDHRDPPGMTRTMVRVILRRPRSA